MLFAAAAAAVQNIKTYVCPAHSSHFLLSAQTSLVLFKDYSDSLGGVYGSRLKPNEVTTQMMAVAGASQPVSVLNLVFQYHCSGVNVERVRGPTVSVGAVGPREFDLLTPAAQHNVLLCVLWKYDFN